MEFGNWVVLWCGVALAVGFIALRACREGKNYDKRCAE